MQTVDPRATVGIGSPVRLPVDDFIGQHVVGDSDWAAGALDDRLNVQCGQQIDETPGIQNQRIVVGCLTTSLHLATMPVDITGFLGSGGRYANTYDEERGGPSSLA